MYHQANQYAATASERIQCANLTCRLDASAEEPGSRNRLGSMYAVLKVLKFTLEHLKAKAEKMAGRIRRFTPNSEAA